MVTPDLFTLRWKDLIGCLNCAAYWLGLSLMSKLSCSRTSGAAVADLEGELLPWCAAIVENAAVKRRKREGKIISVT